SAELEANRGLGGGIDFVKGRQAFGSFRSRNFDLKFTPDPDHGTVLQVYEIGALRRGGFDLPAPREGFGTAKKLSFWARSESRDLFAIRVN
ncbi:hypothetical protein, partial [Salmonella enterica]|uniref:hypothetical protein n=1 Tax=Salmonella enterica TaxID=28901 RepID=UPI003D2D238F